MPYCCPVFSSHFSLGQNHFNDSAVCSPHRVRHRLRVDIHGCADVRVTQEFLLNLQIHSQGVQQGRVRMPKRVPSNPPKSGANSGREQVSSLDRPRPSRPPGPVGTRGKPIGVLRVCCGFLLIFEKESCQRAMHRQTPVAIAVLTLSTWPIPTPLLLCTSLTLLP